MVVMLVLLTIVVFVSIELALDYKSRRQESVALSSVKPEIVQEVNAAIEELETVDEPDGLYYNPAHTWVFLEMNGKVKVGLDQFFQRIVGKIDKIEVPKIGEDLQEDSPAVTIQSRGRRVKARIPVAGRVEAVNETVLKDPEILLTDQYKDGWILRLKPKNFLQSSRSLILGSKAKGWLADEMRRMRDLLTEQVSTEDFALQTMCDGGIPVMGISSIVDDRHWEMIKKEFFGDES